MYQFTFRHVDSSEALQQYAQNELDRVGRHLLKESRWQVHFSKNRHLASCEVYVVGAWGSFKAKAEDTDFYRALDLAAEKLGRQFQRKKEQLQHHKRPEKSREGRIERLNEALEYDNSPHFKKTA